MRLIYWSVLAAAVALLVCTTFAPDFGTALQWFAALCAIVGSGWFFGGLHKDDEGSLK